MNDVARNWKVVKQPNNLLAIFCEEKKEFTHYGQNISGAQNICVQKGLDQRNAESKVLRALKNEDRYINAIEKIRSAHGDRSADSWHTVCRTTWMTT